MSYWLRFENHREPVEVASGYGFKAPKSWGRMLRMEEADDVSGGDCCPDLENDPLADLERQLQDEESKLSELIGSTAEIQKEIGRYDIRILTASGKDRRAMLASARFLKVQQLHDMEARNQTEIDRQRARVASLRRLRSEKRKDLSK